MTGLRVGSPLWLAQWLGFGLVLAGLGVDVAYHLWWTGRPHLSGFGLLGHVVTLAGMLVTTSTVIAAGLRRPAASPSPKGEQHARRRPSTP